MNFQWKYEKTGLNPHKQIYIRTWYEKIIKGISLDLGVVTTAEIVSRLAVSSALCLDSRQYQISGSQISLATSLMRLDTQCTPTTTT